MPLQYIGKMPGFAQHHFTEVGQTLLHPENMTGGCQSPMTQSQIVKDLNEFYSTSEIMPDCLILRVAVHHAMNAYKLQSSAKMIHLDDIFKRNDLELWQESTGLPWNQFGYKTKDDVRNDPEAILKIRYFWHRIKVGEDIHPPDCLAYIRSNVCPIGEKKVSVVWGYPATLSFGEAVFALPLIEKYKERGLFACGYKNNADVLKKICNRFSDRNHFTRLVFKNYDKTVPAWLIEFAFKILLLNVNFVEYEGHGIADARRMFKMWQFIKDYFINTTIRTARGLRFRKNSGISSGSYFAHLIQSICNFILCQWMCLQQCGCFAEDIIVQGDESIMATPKDLELAKCQKLLKTIGQNDGAERSDVYKNQTDKDVPGTSKLPELNISIKTNVASKADTSTANIYYNSKADDDNLDNADNADFESCFDFTIEDVPLEPPKEFSWQETKATVDLADDGDDIQDDLSLYCSDDEDKPPVYGYTENPGGHVGFHCNVCKNEILGFRYVCVQCSDFDLCGGCEAQGAHHQHYVLRVPGPRPYGEVQSVLARIRKHLMVSMNPIQVADDAVSIKSEVKEEDEEMLLQEAETIRVREETENGNEKENQETSQDEGETSQEEADPLQTHNNSEVESSADDSEAEWRPSKKDLADAESTDNDSPSNIRRCTRIKLTNVKPITEEMPSRSNIEHTDKEQQTFNNKPFLTYVAQEKLRIIQSNSGAIFPLPVSQADPKIVLNRINIDKLLRPINDENASQKKIKITMSTCDFFEKFMAGDTSNIAVSHGQPSNVIYTSSSKTNNDDQITRDVIVLKQIL